MKKDLFLENLLKKYLNGTASAEEKAILESWHLEDLNKSSYLPSQSNIERVHKTMRTDILNNAVKRPRPLWPKFAIAAASLTFVIAGLWIFRLTNANRNSRDITQIEPGTFKNDALPGNSAVLTLASGNKITLANLTSANIAKIAGKNVHKSTSGDLVYSRIRETSEIEPVYNVLTIPRGGGKHEIILSDGTLAVLDAGSSLRFPVIFPSSKREVSITGQVYFEVSHNSHQPFSVKVDGETIQDIGTHFNINAFGGHPQTTLIEGSIKVNGLILKPGQQAVTRDNGTVKVMDNADIDEAIGWKNNMFVFNGETSLKTVMDQISRWYDMDVVYVNTGKSFVLGGDMPRYSKLTDVLKILAYSGVKFSIEGKKIIVYQ